MEGVNCLISPRLWSYSGFPSRLFLLPFITGPFFCNDIIFWKFRWCFFNRLIAFVVCFRWYFYVVDCWFLYHFGKRVFGKVFAFSTKWCTRCFLLVWENSKNLKIPLWQVWSQLQQNKFSLSHPVQMKGQSSHLNRLGANRLILHKKREKKLGGSTWSKNFCAKLSTLSHVSTILVVRCLNSCSCC